MKVLVFSDTHLTDKFEEDKYLFIKGLLLGVDKVVVNGDFWDGYLTSFDKFINSDWKKLLKLLSDKDVVYVVGNHDKGSNFAGCVEVYLLKVGKNHYRIEHGDRLDKLSVFDKFGINPVMKGIYRILKLFEKWGVRRWGKNFLNIIYKGYNEMLKNEIKKEIKRKEIYVCSHSHIAEIDVINRFVNTGMIDCGLGQYAVIDEDGPHLFEEKY